MPPGRSGPHWLRPRHPIVLVKMGCPARPQAMEQEGCQVEAAQSAARDASSDQVLSEGGNMVVERLESGGWYGGGTSGPRAGRSAGNGKRDQGVRLPQEALHCLCLEKGAEVGGKPK